MHIGLLQLNPVVGDIAGNTNGIIEAAQALDADLLVTPEMSICGYPPRDLLCDNGFVHACEEAVIQIAQECHGKTLLVGHPRVDLGTGRLRNSVSVIHNGEIIKVCDKQLLPSYDVFDEKRYFEAGDFSATFEVCGEVIGIATCEDFWRGFDANAASMYGVNPLDHLIEEGCTVLVSPSASPFVTGKRETHIQYALEVARNRGVTIAMCNQVGGNDDLVFDGGSFVVSQEGMLGECPVFVADSRSVDLKGKPFVTTVPSDEEERFHALVLGTRDYFRKTGHVKALLGISGGIDSALVASIAVAAIGKEFVTGVLMPSRFSSLGSVVDAEHLARHLEIPTITLPIEHMHVAFERTLEESCLEAGGIAAENAQARIRGLLLMTLANEQGSLVLTTGNKSELAVGYSTLYGDMDGAISVIGDVYKTDVWALSNWINANYALCGFASPPIPEASITKPPSAELRPDQYDQDSLPEYDELDSILRLHIDLDMGVDDIEDELTLEPAFVTKIVRMVDIAQFKRDQAAVILKISPRTFGRGRRMPIVMRRSWSTSRETT
jgi:NAD+ synthase (glutamine-hydrolysing)